MSSASAIRKPSLPALTGLRTLLALSIVFFHFTPPHMAAVAPIIENGYIFVGFFFLMSGYILSYNYADRVGMNKREFWLARFSRLYPVYLLALALSFQMLVSEWSARSHTEFWQGVFLTPLLLQGWLPNLATFWNTVAWTLSCEMMLYLAFPYLIRVSLPRQPWKLIALFLGLWLVGMVPHVLYLTLNPDHLAAPADRYTATHLIRILKYTPPSYICTFLCGLTLGQLQSVLKLRGRERTGIAVLALAAIGAALYVFLPSLPYVLLHGGLLMPLFAALTVGLSGANPVASLFAFPPLVYVGRATFCLYLLHFNALMLIQSSHISQKLHLEALDPWLSYVAVVVLALAAHSFVEVPARKLILRHLGRKEALVKKDAAEGTFAELSPSQR
ncbi:peptidoglycan/LPS O-acetylase OafA/YrhL [Granulicella aggregans]|uniref:Peptidoglycan/LPS O-acetylase OafA/YrhL n=1 Tax=Granulicella aggregans TaxID=474949 RepID=A0A7W8E3T0_9BACT|nr:acyltransferase [Granulicella aggregans]MBB5056450.1 peptidoglycan/LPS O-acetylase OafA/YrhL [Granulicella aggregans]